MKTIFLSAIITICFGLFGNDSFAQNEPPLVQNREEIIIRRNDTGQLKTIIEIDSNNITVNGKPLAEYNGDVTILKRKFSDNNRNVFSEGPRTRIERVQVFAVPEKPFLGVLMAKTDQGVIIKNVVDGSGAKKAGLQEGDIITKVDAKEVISPEDLMSAIGSKRAGDQVNITYLRDGRKKIQKVELGKTEGNTIVMNSDNNINNMKGMENEKFSDNFDLWRPGMPRRHFDFDNSRHKLGLKIQDTRDGIGAKVLNVEKGSSAEKAGLKAGDIITEMNGAKVNGVNEVMSQFLHSENKNGYQIKANRDNTEMNFDVQIPKVLKSIDL